MKIDGFKIGGFANIDLVNLDVGQMYFGVPGRDGLARFERVNASRLKQLYRYAGDLELTFGEFMFDFMLDMDMAVIREKNKAVLKPLEVALGVEWD